MPSSNLISNSVVIIISKLDTAGKNMKNHLLEIEDWTEVTIDLPGSWPDGDYEYLESNNIGMLTIPEDQIYTDYLADGISTDLMIFASKHSSSAGKKSLLVHPTGNWTDDTDYGGEEHQLSYVRPDLIKYGYDKIQEYQDKYDLDEYWTGIECSHHGPTALPFPVIYAEAGGTIEEWEDQDACRLIAEVIYDISEQAINGDEKGNSAFIGLGGNHYCYSFLRYLEDNDLGIGHIAPKYAHEDMIASMVEQAYEKTLSDDIKFLIDKKGIRADDRDRFIEVIDANNWEYEFC